MGDDLKDQLQAWKTGHPDVAKKATKKAAPGLTPKQARRAAEAAARAARAPAAPSPRRDENLPDEELFARAVEDIGDGSVAILEKYGHGHLSGEGDPEEGASHPPEGEAQEPGEPAPRSQASDTNLFLDAMSNVSPVKK